jgi:hypothetical protein
MNAAMNNTINTPATADEREFAEVMLRHYRRAGAVASTALLSRMADASEDGAGRAELLRMARDAVAALPTLN